MKKLFVLLSVIFWSGSFAQTDNMIVNENNVWSTLETHCMPNGNNYSTYHVKFEGDTMIDGFDYKRMWRSDTEDHLEWNFYGFIRENEDHEVFVRPPDYIEGKIYDFGVEVGDSVVAKNIYLNSDTLHFVVTDIDYVEMLDGLLHKQITLFEYINQQEEIWIEGLGSLYGILNSCNNAYGSMCGSYKALCYEESDILVYHDPEYSTCHFESLVSVQNQMVKSFNIYPNPAHDFINIDFEENISSVFPYTIELFNLKGQKVFEKLVWNDKNILYLQKVNKEIHIINIRNSIRKYPSTMLVID